MKERPEILAFHSLSPSQVLSFASRIFFFFCQTLEKLQCSKNRVEIFLQLIFIRNEISKTWHSNKTLSEWFNEKQIYSGRIH